MKRKTRLPELLAPAGNFECLIAAVEGGADAVYVGGKKFGARAYAKNFDIDELSRAVVYCHLHGVKLYVTVNTLVLDIEMGEVVEYAARLWEIGVDALIIADLGAIREIRKHIPELELHASTQMSVHNTLGAEAAYNMGCTRVVLARELSLADIKSVTENCSAETEVFLHGALCVCHSGQCLFSSMVGGRSGNRGECAQPCRLPYNGGKYPLSLKDLSLANHIPELVASGVASLKIEGRMKSPDYVYTVTSIYRRLLDECRGANEKENRALRRAFSRDGFTDGYLKGNPEAVELGVRSEADKEESRTADTREFLPKRKKVCAEVEILRNKPCKMTLISEDKRVTAEGAVPAEAENAPLTEEAVKARLSKTGNTYLSLDVSDIALSLDEGLNLAPSALNALRRQASEAFESCRRTEITEEYFYKFPKMQTKALKTAQILGENTACSIPDVLSDFDAIFVSLFCESIPERASGIYLPPVITDGEMSEVRAKLSMIDKTKIKSALVSNIGQINLAREYGLTPICDFRLNVTNGASKRALYEMGAEHIILSPEITLPQARDIGGGVIVYGRIPLMITERCFMKDLGGCSKCSDISLVDRRGEKFPMLKEYKHRNLILNSKITYMGDKSAELQKNRISSYHFIFTTEREGDARGAVTAFKSGRKLSGSDVRRVGRRKTNK